MPAHDTIWYRLGYAFEQARQAPETGSRKLAGLMERAKREVREEEGQPSYAEHAEHAGHAGHGHAGLRDRGSRGRPDAGGRDGGAEEASSDASSGGAPVDDGSAGDGPAIPFDVNELAMTAVVALAAKALDRARPDEGGGIIGVVRAAAAGAAAALVLELIHPVLQGQPRLGELGEDTPDRMLAGAGQGLIYGAVIDRWVPGPALLKGAAFGSLEHAVYPMGGLRRLIGDRTALSRVPALTHMLDGLEPPHRPLAEHVAFGVATAIFYGPRPSPKGRGAPEGE